MISKLTFSFLKDLEKHNTREWFANHRKEYEASKSEMLKLMQDVEFGLNTTDEIERKKLFRINRDVRFSKNKSPYKTNLSGYYARAGARRRGSYYFSIEPGGRTQVGGGFYGPNKEDLLRIRREFEMDGTEIDRITKDKNFIKHFGELRGNGVATAPRDFDKSDPNIKWIRMKQFYAFRTFSDKEVLSPSFANEVMSTFIAIRPFFDYMSDVLTTNLNGESLL
ncbi:MAG: TIGR02453 family protein [Bacteroidetes bacterium]|nr:MAG: TIGR02453 family protein [Bacteroidota bacterium]